MRVRMSSSCFCPTAWLSGEAKWVNGMVDISRCGLTKAAACGTATCEWMSMVTLFGLTSRPGRPRGRATVCSYLFHTAIVPSERSCIGSVGGERARQNLARGLRAVERPQRSALDLPALRGAGEHPAVGGDAVDAKSFRSAMIGHLDGFTGRLRRKDLQIRRHHGLVAVDRDMRQAGEMREAAADGRLMSGAREDRGDLTVTFGAGQVGAAVEHPVLGIDLHRVVVGAGIGAGRMAGNKIEDLQPVLHRTQALLEGAAVTGAFVHCELRFLSSRTARIREPIRDPGTPA